MMETATKPRGAPKGPAGTKHPPNRPKRASGPARPQSGPIDRDADPRRLITIRQFCDMMGMKDRSWYYKHRSDPGFPAVVAVNGEPRLVWQECADYRDAFIVARDT